MVDLDTVDFGNLRAHIEVNLPDWRDPRGIRHDHAVLLTIGVAAVLTGARNITAIGEFAADLDDELCARFGVRFHNDCYQVPHPETFRRAFAGVDPEALDRVIGSWLTENLPTEALRAIAIDGKTLRGAWNEHGRQVHLLAAMTHDEGAVLAQQEVPTDKTNEITMVRDLLGGLDLTGVVITADALHAQRDHAEFIAGEADGDYLFTVKGNQPTLLAAIQNIFDDGSFSPSVPDD